MKSTIAKKTLQINKGNIIGFLANNSNTVFFVRKNEIKNDLGSQCETWGK